MALGQIAQTEAAGEEGEAEEVGLVVGGSGTGRKAPNGCSPLKQRKMKK